MSKNKNNNKGNNNNVIQDITNSDIHIGDKIYNNPEQYKAHIADLQTNLREKGQVIEDLRLVVKGLRTDKQYWQQKSTELEKQYQDKNISKTEYLSQKETLERQIQAKDDLIAAKDEERNELITENLRQSTEINALQARLDIAEKALAELQEKYKDIDFSKQTETYKKAYDFILVGNVQAADDLLSEVYFAEREAKIAEQTKEFYRPLAQEYILKAQTLTANFKWEEAEDYYKKATEKCPDAEFWSAYAYFLQELNQFDKATEYYEQALAQRREENDEPKIATILYNLANLQRITQQLVLAETNYKEALEIFRKVEKESSALMYLIKSTLAQENYNESLKILKKLEIDKGVVSIIQIAETLNNLAILQIDTQQFALAETNYQEALDIRRKLTKENPAAHDLDYCGSALNLCLLYMTYVQKGNLQYLGLATTLLADAAHRLHKYLDNPQAQWHISEQLIPLQQFFRQYDGHIYDVSPKKKNFPSLKENLHLPSLKDLVSVYDIFQQAKESPNSKAAIALYDKCIAGWEKMLWETNEDKDSYAEAHLRRGMCWSLSNQTYSITPALQDFEKAAALCTVQLEDDVVWALLLETTYQHCKEIDKTIPKGFMSGWFGKKEKQQIQALKKTTFDLLVGKELNEDAQRWKEKLEKEF